jgi:F0F1-type ATP synthase assembly protein I
VWNFKWVREYSDYFYLGFLFPSAIVVGTGMGYFVDKWLHIDPWGKILGFVFGVFAGALNFYRDYKKITAKKNESRKD